MEDLQKQFENRIKSLEKSAEASFWGHLGCSLESVTRQSAVISLELKSHHLNPMGILHGGVSASLMDTAMGLAAMALMPEEKIVTSNLDVHFLAPIRDGKVTAEGVILHHTKRTLTVQGKVLDSAGNLCAFGTGSFRVT